MGCNCEHQGMPPEIPKGADTRLEICAVCPSLKRFHGGLPAGADVGLLDRCADCGCFVRAKVLLPAAECPQGKW